MTIDELYKNALKEIPGAKEKLFESLSARFRYFSRQKVWDPDDAEDVVQDALLIINREFKNVEIKVSFYSWAYRVFDLRVLNYVNKKGTRKDRFQQIDSEQTPAPEPPPESFSELKRQLLDCLNKIIKINPRYARILNFQYQGFTTEEICDKLKVNRNNCYSILYRARSLLEICLEKGDIK